MEDILEYVWLDKNNNLRSKVRTIGEHYFIDVKLENHILVDLNKSIDSKSFAKKLQWSYDGSSTGQANGDNSEVLLLPVFICKNGYYNDKYNATNYYIAFCQTFNHKMEPLENNNYNKLIQNLDKDEHTIPYFGFEQEFFLMQVNPDNNTEPSKLPVGYDNENVAQQESQQYYCSNGANYSFGRNIVNTVYHSGLSSGLRLSGLNAEVAIGQWEIQVGPVQGVEACHQLWLLRFLLIRIAEDFEISIDLHPKPVPDWNGSGLHTNFSNKTMRTIAKEPKNQYKIYEYIEEFVKKLENSHEEAMLCYGEDNEERMTGECETADYEKFTYGVADRGSSIRIPRNVFLNKYGYIEDRRPGANADPYNIYQILMNV